MLNRIHKVSFSDSGKIRAENRKQVKPNHSSSSTATTTTTTTTTSM